MQDAIEIENKKPRKLHIRGDSFYFIFTICGN